MAVDWKRIFPKASVNEPVEYLIDGEAYYNRLLTDFTSLKSGDAIYIMGWMFQHDFDMFPKKIRTTTPLDLFVAAVKNNIDVKIFIWDNPLYIQENARALKDLTAAGVDIRMEASKFPLHNSALTIMQSILPYVYASIYGPLMVISKYASFLNIFGVVFGKLERFITALNYVKNKVKGGIPNISTCAYHDKVTIIIKDSKAIAYCGGIDYNANRLNNSMHDVQCRVEGPEAVKILSKFVFKWNQYLPAANHITAPALTTFALTSKVYSYAYAVGNHNYSLPNKPVPLPDFHRTLSDAYFKIIDQAERFIYIEDQYMVNQEVAAALNKKLVNSKIFDLILVIQCDEKTVEDLSIPGRMRTRFIEIVRGAPLNTASSLDSKISVLSIDAASAKLGQYPAGIHSKIMIADDDIAIIGSSNVNQRSFTHDSETSLIIFDDNKTVQKFAKQFRIALWRKYAFLTTATSATPHWIEVPFLFRINITHNNQTTMLQVYAPNTNGDLDEVVKHYSVPNASPVLSTVAGIAGVYASMVSIISIFKTYLNTSFFNNFFRYVLDPHLDNTGNHSNTPPKF